MIFERSHAMHAAMLWVQSKSDLGARAVEVAVGQYEENLAACYAEINRLQRDLERQKELHAAELAKLPQPPGITKDEWEVIAELREVAPASTE